MLLGATALDTAALQRRLTFPVLGVTGAVEWVVLGAAACAYKSVLMYVFIYYIDL